MTDLLRAFLDLDRLHALKELLASATSLAAWLLPLTCVLLVCWFAWKLLR